MNNKVNLKRKLCLGCQLKISKLKALSIEEVSVDNKTLPLLMCKPCLNLIVKTV